MSNVEGMYRTANRRTVECRISNVEGRNSIDFIKKTERPNPLTRLRRPGSKPPFLIPVLIFERRYKRNKRMPQKKENNSAALCFIYKMIERSDSTLRHSLFDILRFFGSLLSGSSVRFSLVLRIIRSFKSEIPGPDWIYSV
jgi:hypothetical protein